MTGSNHFSKYEQTIRLVNVIRQPSVHPSCGIESVPSVLPENRVHDEGNRNRHDRQVISLKGHIKELIFMFTSAIYLGLLIDVSTENFLIALKRFIPRRERYIKTHCLPSQHQKSPPLSLLITSCVEGSCAAPSIGHSVDVPLTPSFCKTSQQQPISFLPSAAEGSQAAQTTFFTPRKSSASPMNLLESKWRTGRGECTSNNFRRVEKLGVLVLLECSKCCFHPLSDSD
ncbi:hypothetical protein CEXT_460051 [Caerostris extrusa]|uniref:Uncharacterized protein n=1 Tax=Caerostris extrusa TaxID=172846 RepID=A0AAV4UY74_CAEEX|nr:hypothetical protein CEXT_460051 [Caerostris extrusa]